jgi:hypothetical protein
MGFYLIRWKGDYRFSELKAKSESFQSCVLERMTDYSSRMLKSAQNFAAGESTYCKISDMETDYSGFFGIPAEDQYNLEVMIEWPGFNNTLAPWNTVSPLPSYGS